MIVLTGQIPYTSQAFVIWHPLQNSSLDSPVNIVIRAENIQSVFVELNKMHIIRSAKRNGSRLWRDSVGPRGREEYPKIMVEQQLRLNFKLYHDNRPAKLSQVEG